MYDITDQWFATFFGFIRCILFNIIIYIVIASSQKTIYFSYFVTKLLFSSFIVSNFIYLLKSNFFMRDFNWYTVSNVLVIVNMQDQWAIKIFYFQSSQ